MTIAERDLRYSRVRKALAAAGIGGLLSYAPGWRREDFRYLTDAPLRGSFALLHLPLDGEPTAFVLDDDRDAVLDAGWVTEVRPLDLADLRTIADVVGSPDKLGISHAEILPLGLRDQLAAALSSVSTVSASAVMSAVRIVKTDEELARMRRCGEMTDAGWQAFMDAMSVGVPEYRIVAEVEGTLKAMGATDNFMLIASGGDEVRGMSPASDRILRVGDMVRTELTPQVNGYWTQICRSAVLGPASDGQRRSHELFTEALEAGLSVLRAGVTAHDVAMAENDVFRAHGMGEYCTSQYTRVRGHGHGAHFDEVPIIEGADTVLEKNAVVIVHPNTYTPLAGYHVIGDPVVVTTDGWEPLLHTPRPLLEVEVL